jgi:hypothetical protein
MFYWICVLCTSAFNRHKKTVVTLTDQCPHDWETSEILNSPVLFRIKQRSCSIEVHAIIVRPFHRNKHKNFNMFITKTTTIQIFNMVLTTEVFRIIYKEFKEQKRKKIWLLWERQSQNYMTWHMCSRDMCEKTHGSLKIWVIVQKFAWKTWILA